MQRLYALGDGAKPRDNHGLTALGSGRILGLLPKESVTVTVKTSVPLDQLQAALRLVIRA